MRTNLKKSECAAAEEMRRATPCPRKRRSHEALINSLVVLVHSHRLIYSRSHALMIAAPAQHGIAGIPIRVNWRPLTVRLPASEAPGSRLPRQFLPMQCTVQNGATLHANFPPGFAARPATLRGEGSKSQASGLPKQAAARLNKATQASRRIAFASLACKPIRTPDLTAAFSSLSGFGAKHPSRIVGKYRETPNLQNHPNREISGYLGDSREMHQSLFSFRKYRESFRTTPCHGQIVNSDLYPDLTRNALTYHPKILIQSDRFRPNLTYPNRSLPLRRRTKGAVASRSQTLDSGHWSLDNSPVTQCSLWKANVGSCRLKKIPRSCSLIPAITCSVPAEGKPCCPNKGLPSSWGQKCTMSRKVGLLQPLPPVQRGFLRLGNTRVMRQTGAQPINPTIRLSTHPLPNMLLLEFPSVFLRVHSVVRTYASGFVRKCSSHKFRKYQETFRTAPCLGLITKGHALAIPLKVNPGLTFKQPAVWPLCVTIT
ncbi:MAG: hypothetical protein JWM16_3531 [Verrucomicrobiales bacterium]|nr:hypothetical protein [Verrucomicrobiales bacterium]